MAWVELAAERLAPTVGRIADWLSGGPLQHADATGMRIAGKRSWLHVNSTRELTHLAWHGRRGHQALEDIGIWPRFRGRAVRDRWASYDFYQCAQSMCGEHLVRDCTYVQQQEQQVWAEETMDLRLRMATAAEEWRQRGLPAVPAEERDAWVAQYARVACQRLCSPAPARSRRRTQTRRAAQAECAQESTRCVGSRAPSRCWPISLIYRSRLPIFRLNETCE